jgi:hypothetical protein
MPSWRDSASDQCQADLDGLLNHILEFAQGQVGKRGVFAPFGASITLDGQVQLLAAAEHMPSAEMTTSLVRGVSSQRASLRAVAFGSAVRLPDGADAIRCDLEHRDGVAIAVLLAYHKKRLGRGVEYGQLKAAPAVARVWQEPSI